MPQKRERSPESDREVTAIFRSAPLEDRSSTFIGYYSPLLKPKELQGLEEIQSASHKILAWRRESNQQSITGSTKYVTDHDDDGERYAGKKIENVLDSIQATGSCVVARWYGGVLLGPVRFTHIENCAKEAIQKWKEAEAEGQLKKRKLEEDERAVARLVNVLAQRDQSIGVLRQLAVEKENALKEEKTTSNPRGQMDGGMPATTQEGTPTTKPALDYEGMSLDRLKALEKARDATLSFLLKRIDKAERDLAGLKGSPSDVL